MSSTKNPEQCPYHQAGDETGKVLVQTQSEDDLFSQAKGFLEMFHVETGAMEALPSRLRAVEREIVNRGFYEHEYEELVFGARVAWRQEARCIGRLFWKSLKVFDAREVCSPRGVFEKLSEHAAYAYNEGRIRSTMTVFAPERPGESAPRVLNHQFFRYAGYRTEDGFILGDGMNIELTETARGLGFEPGCSAFDRLPLMVQDGDGRVSSFPIDDQLWHEVALEHPQLPWFAEMGLRWYAVPMISDMVLEIGGIFYPCSPFNGWYMGTEIGSRNFADPDRYNLLPELARRMGVDTEHQRSLWKDRALLELNLAVLHSYEKAGVRLVDHHKAAEEYMRFQENERARGRPVNADWSWIVPPMSAASTPVFHQAMTQFPCSPRFIKKSDYFG